jgi:hypothetical protein
MNDEFEFPPEMKEFFEGLGRIMTDDETQNEISLSNMPEFMLKKFTSGLICDKLPDGHGPFGLSVTNPIPVNATIGEVAYLSHLRTPSGERLLFHRLGSTKSPVTPDPVDIFEAVSIYTNVWYTFYLEFYHIRKSWLTPPDFTFSDMPSQFSGFSSNCGADFPYNFPEMKDTLSPIIGMCYIPISMIAEQLENKVYKRPDRN